MDPHVNKQRKIVAGTPRSYFQSMGSLHPVFQKLDARQLKAAEFDEALAANRDRLVGVFFWGHDCPNCEVAKKMLNQDADQVLALGIQWFHVNVYEDFDLGTRFGLHGIPTFLFFHQDRKLGKITPFPGIEPFMTALRELRRKHPEGGSGS